MSLRESPAIRTARLPDGREIAVRVVVPDDPYVPQSEIDTVVAELEEGGTVLAVVTTPLSATDVERAGALADSIRVGLESEAFPATAEGIETVATTVPL